MAPTKIASDGQGNLSNKVPRSLNNDLPRRSNKDLPRSLNDDLPTKAAIEDKGRRSQKITGSIQTRRSEHQLQPSLNTTGKLSNLSTTSSRPGTGNTPASTFDGSNGLGNLVRPVSLPLPSPSKTKTKMPWQGGSPDVTRLPDDWASSSAKRWKPEEKKEIERLLDEFRRMHASIARPKDFLAKKQILDDHEQTIRGKADGGEAGEKALVNVEIWRSTAQTHLKMAQAELGQLDKMRSLPTKNEKELHQKRCAVWDAFKDAKANIEFLGKAIEDATGLPGGIHAAPVPASCDCCGYQFKDDNKVCSRCKAKRVVQFREDPGLFRLLENFELSLKKALSGAQADILEGESIIGEFLEVVQKLDGANLLVTRAFDQAQEALLQAKQDLLTDSKTNAWQPSLTTKIFWYEASFDRSKDMRNRPFGLEMEPKNHCLCIKAILSGSLVADAAKFLEGDEQIRVDDLIADINGVSDDTDSMLSEYKRSTRIKLKIKRISRAPNWQPPKSDFYFGKTFAEIDSDPLVVATKQIDALEQQVRNEAAAHESQIRDREAVAAAAARRASLREGSKAVALFQEVEAMQRACKEDMKVLSNAKSLVDRARLRMSFEEKIMLPVIEDMVRRISTQREGLRHRVSRHESILNDLARESEINDNSLKTHTGDLIQGVIRIDLDGTPNIAKLIPLKEDDDVKDTWGVRMTHQLDYVYKAVGAKGLSRPRLVCYDPKKDTVSDKDALHHDYKMLPLMQFTIDRNLFIAAEIGERSHDADPRHGTTNQLLYLSRKVGDEWVRIDRFEETLRTSSGKCVPYRYKVPLAQWSYEDGKAKPPELVLGPDFDGQGSSFEKMRAVAELVDLKNQLKDADILYKQVQLQRMRADIRLREVKKDALVLYHHPEHSGTAELRIESMQREVDGLHTAMQDYIQKMQGDGISVETSVAACVIEELQRTKSRLEAEVLETEARLDDVFGQILKSVQVLDADVSETSPAAQGDREARTDYLEDVFQQEFRLHPKDKDFIALDKTLKTSRELQRKMDSTKRTLEINRVRQALAMMVLHIERAENTLKTIKEGAILAKSIDNATDTINVEMREGFYKGQLVIIAHSTESQETNYVKDFGPDYVVFKNVTQKQHARGTTIVFRTAVVEKESQLSNLRHQIASVVKEYVKDRSSDTVAGLAQMDTDLQHLRTLLDDAKSMLVEAEVVVTFQPEHIAGPIGIETVGDQVAELNIAGQARDAGVEVSWRIKAVNGENCESFDDALFEDAKSGDEPYRVTFAKAEKGHQDMRIVEQNFYKSRLAAFVSDTDEGKLSPRTTAPELKFSQQTLELASRLAAEVAAKEARTDPWQPGGTGTRSLPRFNRSYALHFDMNLKAQNIRISSDQTSASWAHGGYGGFVFSVEPLRRRGLGRYFEVMVEGVDTTHGSDGIGIGLAARPLPEHQRGRPDPQGVYEGFANENLPEAWLVGYDGRTNLLGQTRCLRGQELPKMNSGGSNSENALFPPRRGRFADGHYQKTDVVECLLPGSKEWSPATVIDKDAKGNILLEIGIGSTNNKWMTIEMQTRMVRPKRGIYERYVGNYLRNEWVQVYTSIEKDWVPSRVIDVRDGSILLDSAPDVWIVPEEQAHNVRPCRGFHNGGKIGLLNTPEGHLYYFWNDEVKYAVMNANIPWSKELNAVIDLDGCVQAIHLMDTNGSVPPKVVSCFMALPKPGTLAPLPSPLDGVGSDPRRTSKPPEDILARNDTRTLESQLGRDMLMFDELELQSLIRRDSAAPWLCSLCNVVNLGMGRFCERCNAENPLPELNQAPALKSPSRMTSQESLASRSPKNRASGMLSRKSSSKAALEGLPGVTQPRDKVNHTVVTFQPGPVGIEENNGLVLQVLEGGQAQREGVNPGWRIAAVGNQSCFAFKESVFQEAKAGSASFQVTFVKEEYFQSRLRVDNFTRQLEDSRRESFFSTPALPDNDFSFVPQNCAHLTALLATGMSSRSRNRPGPNQSTKAPPERPGSSSLSLSLGRPGSSSMRLSPTMARSNSASRLAAIGNRLVSGGHDPSPLVLNTSFSETALSNQPRLREEMSLMSSTNQPRLREEMSVMSSTNQPRLREEISVMSSTSQPRLREEMSVMSSTNQPRIREEMSGMSSTEDVVVGERVEVFSNSLQNWCAGEVTEIKIENGTKMVRVQYNSGNGTSLKWIEWGHKNIRREKIGSQMASSFTSQSLLAKPHLPSNRSRSHSPAVEEGSTIASRKGQGVSIGDHVEIFSNSMNKWCPGVVSEVIMDDGHKSVRVSYQAGTSVSSKVIGWGHRNIRLVEQGGPHLQSDRLASSGRSREARSTSPAFVDHPAHRSDVQVKVGEKVEIFSQSQQVWCSGEIVEVSVGSDERMVKVDYHVGNVISTKVLALNHPNLRRAS